MVCISQSFYCNFPYCLSLRSAFSVQRPVLKRAELRGIRHSFIPYNTTGKFIVLCIFNAESLRRRREDIQDSELRDITKISNLLLASSSM